MAARNALFRPEESRPKPQPLGAVVLGGLADAFCVVRVTVPPERLAASDLPGRKSDDFGATVDCLWPFRWRAMNVCFSVRGETVLEAFFACPLGDSLADLLS
jgi:hypothetical protein